ncbi:GGDEF domain-containing protein [Teredinibacter sp. KSP-S5-2]|uniref:GGDEF domain-containing protein n=1 Tax=Teredinibacter sp. KSP-S5-2 TaxID=3034506 RepID=UPI0029346226|nr:GGDEF domain-containing protein [Teredinibacter sp. KSP-S5-2]WNO07584.1 GGDEF domain-containing protein [Teredinibacter sp. KSP-S5-2]
MDAAIRQQLKQKAKIELALIISVNVFLFSLFSEADLLESIYQFSRVHETWELDEIVPIFFSLTICLAIYSYRRQKDMAILYAEANRLSKVDPLTDLPHRQEFIHQISEQSKKDSGDLPFFAITVSLNNLKTINDQHGFLRGDKLLVNISKVVKNSLNSIEYCTRWSSRDIIVFKRFDSEGSAMEFTEQLQRKLRQVLSGNHARPDLRVSLLILPKECGLIKMLQYISDFLSSPQQKPDQQVKIITPSASSYGAIEAKEKKSV